MNVSDAVMHALRASGKKQSDLTDILRVSSPQAANKKVREGIWTEEDLIAVAEFTGSRLLMQMPDGDQIELK